MAEILSALSIVTWLIVIFSLIGIGMLSLVLRDSSEPTLKSAWLLAPLVGYILVAALGLVKVHLFLPLQPAFNIGLLVLLALTACWLRRKHIGKMFSHLSLRDKTELVAPAVLALIQFSIAFQSSGLELLSGSEDELQYCSNATYMMLYQNTGTANDTPVPRIDHWLNDWVSRHLCFAWNYRKGAEVLLATVSAITGLSTPVAFPVLCGTVITVLNLAIGFVGLDCLELGRKRTAVLQLGFLCLFYLTALHLQGSLANLCSIPCFITGAALLRLALCRDSSFGIAALCGILFGGGVLIYGEVVIPLIVIPAVAVILERLIAEGKTGLLPILKRVSLLVVVSLVVSAGGLRAVIPNFVYNLSVVQKAPNKTTTPLTRELFLIPFANQAGIGSPFDDGSAEGFVSTSLTSQPARLFAYAGVLLLCGIFGYCNFGRKGIGLFAPFFVLAVICGLLFFAHEQFRLFRAVGYLMPYLLVGLVLSTVKSSGPRFGAVGIAVLTVFLAMNEFANLRTTLRITSHSLQTDKILHRLNPDAPEWCALRSELNKYPKAPVLVSGYPDTRTPHWVISGIEPHPNLIGDSIVAHWPLYLSRDRFISDTKGLCSYRRPNILEESAKWDWKLEKFRLINESQQALVPPGEPFPAEWRQWYDVLPAFRARYTNICDVVYKHRTALIADEALGGLEGDSVGKFRLLKSVWHPALLDDEFAIYSLRIRFDGVPSDMMVQGFDPALTFPKYIPESSQQTRIELALPSFNFGKLGLVPRGGGVKLRSIELTKLPI